MAELAPKQPSFEQPECQLGIDARTHSQPGNDLGGAGMNSPAKVVVNGINLGPGESARLEEILKPIEDLKQRTKITDAFINNLQYWRSYQQQRDMTEQ